MFTEVSPALERVSISFALLQWASMDGYLCGIIKDHVCLSRLVDMMPMYSALEPTSSVVELLALLMMDAVRGDMGSRILKSNKVRAVAYMLESEDDAKATWALDALCNLATVGDFLDRLREVVNAKPLVRFLRRDPLLAHDAIWLINSILCEGAPLDFALELVSCDIASHCTALMDVHTCKTLAVKVATNTMLCGTMLRPDIDHHLFTLKLAGDPGTGKMMEKVIEVAKQAVVGITTCLKFFQMLSSKGDARYVQDKFQLCGGLRWGVELVGNDEVAQDLLMAMLTQFIRGNECSTMEVLRANGVGRVCAFMDSALPSCRPTITEFLYELAAGDEPSTKALDEAVLACRGYVKRKSDDVARFVVRQQERLRKYDKAQSQRAMLLRKRDYEAMGADFTTVEAYLCPITRDIMLDPVVASDGNTYERDAIERILCEGNGLSPFTRERLQPRVYPNNVLRGFVHEHFEDVAKAVDAREGKRPRLQRDAQP